MKRLKAIFSAIRTLGRNPNADIMSAWARISDALDEMHTTSTMVADRHLIGQVLNGVLDEATAYLKKQGEQVETPTA